MKRKLITLTVCGLLAISAALAVEGVMGPQQAFPMDAARNGRGAVHLALVYRSDGPVPVNMPAPRDPDRGPLAFAGSDLAMTRGSALPNTGGGAFMSERQQADQSIRQLIRKLG